MTKTLSTDERTDALANAVNAVVRNRDLFKSLAFSRPDTLYSLVDLSRYNETAIEATLLDSTTRELRRVFTAGATKALRSLLDTGALASDPMLHQQVRDAIETPFTEEEHEALRALRAPLIAAMAAYCERLRDADGGRLHAARCEHVGTPGLPPFSFKQGVQPAVCWCGGDNGR